MSIWKDSFSTTSFLSPIRLWSGGRFGMPRLALCPKVKLSRLIILLLVGLMALVSNGSLAQAANLLNDATVAGDADEVSTNYVKGVLDDQDIWIFDARPADEYAMSHIPGALNVAQKPGTL